MIPGYGGKILRVDLTKGQIKKESLDKDFARKFLGGRGFGAKVLFNELERGIDPLSPKNKLIFAVGPFTGLTLKGCRYSVVTKSPLTLTYMDSEAGGFFGPELKFTGHDLVIIEGRCESPTYLFIEDDIAELRDASSVWGKGVSETEKIIRNEVGDRSVRVAAIGPAGENLVRFASITSDSRQAARGGVGAVMGSKRLKAIAVKGTKGIEVADPENVMKLTEEHVKKTMDNPVAKNLRDKGTLVYMPIYNDWGVVPTRNFRSGYFEFHRNLTAEIAWDKIWSKNRACFMCPIACAKIGSVGEYIVDGPDYETACLLGSNCGLDDLKTIALANSLCDDLGLDTISTGNVIAFVMECYERGILSKEKVGLELGFGKGEAVVELIKRIVLREGVGNILAEGVKRAAEMLGANASDFAVHVKGLELPGYEPRSSPAMGLAYAVADIGGSHDRSWPIGEEVSSQKFERFGVEGKAEMVRKSTFLRTLPDILGFCRFVVLDFADYAKILSAITGWEISAEELRGVVERVNTLTRAFNAREGFTRKDDILPAKMFSQAVESGPTKGKVFRKEDLDSMLDEYYELWGWDKNGVPKEETLRRLGLEEVIESLKYSRVTLS